MNGGAASGGKIEGDVGAENSCAGVGQGFTQGDEAVGGVHKVGVGGNDRGGGFLSKGQEWEEQEK